MNGEALVVTGDGVGNIIQSTPTISFLHDMGYAVDVAMPGAPTGAIPLIEPSGAVREVTLHPGLFRNRMYTVVSPNFLHSDAVKGWGFKNCARVLHPIKAETKEAQAQWEGTLRFLDWWPPTNQRKLLKTWCCYDVTIQKLAGRRNLALCMGSKTNGQWLLKRYPPTYYSMVVRELMQGDPELHVYVFGAGKDDTIDRNILIQEYHDRIHLVWDQPLIKVSSMLRLCDFYLGNDTGLSHIAAAHGTHSFIVFGPTEARRSMPPFNATPIVLPDIECRPCQTHHVLGTGVARMGEFPPGEKCHHTCMRAIPWTQIYAIVYGAYREFTP